MKVETCRSTRAEALDQTGVGQLDLDALLSVKPDRPLALGHGSSLVRYRVHLKDGDPAAAFISGPSQKVVSLDAHTAEITVYGLRPGVTGGNSAAPDEKPGDDDRAPNNLIQSDNAEIVAMAAQAAGAEKDPWKTAVALEGYVRRTVATTTKDSSGAFSTAADVARTREGDCKAHAVLLAALARARGIPARVAIGLVYVARTGVFGYHMWNEVYIDTRWFPLDATLGRGGIGGGHLKLAHRSLAGATAVGSFFPVMKVSGRLQIDVLEEK
jgi:transglutaminase-like putative cysteine protease